MKNYKYFKNDIFTTNTHSGVDINKLLIRRLGDLGITTVDKCCSDGTQTIDEQIAAINTRTGSYTEYSVLISQTSTSAPTAKVLNKTIEGTFTLGYTSAGEYTITATGMFTADKTQIIFLPSQSDTIVYGVWTSANVVTLHVAVASTGTPTNAKITDSALIIRVYN